MNKDYYKTIAFRVRQRAKLLIARENFQKDVIFLRNKWKIPQKGLTTQKENENWNNWILDETDSYYNKKWPKETKKIFELRRSKKYIEAEEVKKSINRDSPLNALNNDVWVIILNYDLPAKWHEGLKNYLLSNDPKFLSTQTGLIVNFNWDHGVMRPSIEFDKNTTLPDLKRAWSWARKIFRNKKDTKFQPMRNFDRDKRIYELKSSGSKSKDIEEIIQNEFGNSLSYSDIDTIFRRYKKRFNIN